MHRRFQPLKTVLSREIRSPYAQPKFKPELTLACNDHNYHQILPKALVYAFSSRNLSIEPNPYLGPCNFTDKLAIDRSRTDEFVALSSSKSVLEADESTLAKDAIMIQNLLKAHAHDSMEKIERVLNQSELSLTEDLVLLVLRRHRSDWRLAYMFFNWACQRDKDAGGYEPGFRAFNEMLDILGRMRRFEQADRVLDKMSKREGLINERTMAILLNRYAAADKVDEATELFYRRKQFGLPLDLIAFQTLLMSLCRHKHVEVAEFLFRSKRGEFPPDIKSWNIILNGWCVLGNLRETKRFWNDIVSSRCERDLFTYGIFINALTKAGKLSKAIQLFHAMWEKGCTPDVAICNCIIDALCFKKRIPEALEIFGEMNEKGCLPDTATYNSLIKHLCKIRRMEKVYELLDEMEQKKGHCTPNPRTYSYLLKSLKKPEEVPQVLERMKKNGCVITADAYNLILKLFMDWNHELEARSMWSEMDRNGLGPDQRSYTIMVHGLHKGGKMEEALQYFHEMMSKGLIPEPRTKLLVKAIKLKLEEREKRQMETMNNDSSVSGSAKCEKKMRKGL